MTIDTMAAPSSGIYTFTANEQNHSLTSNELVSALTSSLSQMSDTYGPNEKNVRFSDFDNLFVYQAESSSRPYPTCLSVAHSLSRIHSLFFPAENHGPTVDTTDATTNRKTNVHVDELFRSQTTKESSVTVNAYTELDKMFEDLFSEKSDQSASGIESEESGLGVWYNSLPDGRIVNNFTDNDFCNRYESTISDLSVEQTSSDQNVPDGFNSRHLFARFLHSLNNNIYR